MDTKTNPSTKFVEKELIITRIFDAPRELVWKAWTDPEEAKKWWGPKSFTAPYINIDLRVGGKYLNCMRGAGPDGVVRDFWSTGVYREIVPLKRLVITDSFADEKGNVVPATYYGMSDFPLEMQVIVTFEDYGGKTRFTLKYPSIEGINATDFANMKQGWNESFDKLDDELAMARGLRAA
jgi:uncharacterized protein YndB with AHSA1/START domain